MRCLVLVGALFSGACVSVPAADLAEPGGRTATYVGVVRVRLPAQNNGLLYADVKAFGLGWDGAAFLGWRAGQWVTADPARCQLLVIVRSGVEAESAERLFRGLKEQQPCIADFRNAVRGGDRSASQP